MIPKIHSSVMVLHKAALLRWTDSLLLLKRLQAKAPREFNLRLKEWQGREIRVAEPQDVTIQLVSREEAEAGMKAFYA